MKHDDALATFVYGTHAAWGPLSSELIAMVSRELATLVNASDDEDWLADLHTLEAPHTELHRDPDFGFLLLAHTEQDGLYRPPHDHGRSWVIYAVQRGAIEMGTYGRIRQPDGHVRLVKRGSSVLHPGDVQAYLPGDIHDTRCLSASTLLFRFTERDLKQDDSNGHRITRYVQADGAWTTPDVAA